MFRLNDRRGPQIAPRSLFIAVPPTRTRLLGELSLFTDAEDDAEDDFRSGLHQLARLNIDTSQSLNLASS